MSWKHIKGTYWDFYSLELLFLHPRTLGTFGRINIIYLTWEAKQDFVFFVKNTTVIWKVKFSKQLWFVRRKMVLDIKFHLWIEYWCEFEGSIELPTHFYSLRCTYIWKLYTTQTKRVLKSFNPFWPREN